MYCIGSLCYTQLYCTESAACGSPECTPIRLADSVEAAAVFVRSQATIHACITVRIDRLRPSHQLTLKARLHLLIASVVLIGSCM